MNLLNRGDFRVVKVTVIATYVIVIVVRAYVVEIANADAHVPVTKLLSKELQINRGSKAPTNAYSGCRCNTNKKTNNKR